MMQPYSGSNRDGRECPRNRSAAQVLTGSKLQFLGWIRGLGFRFTAGLRHQICDVRPSKASACAASGSSYLSLPVGGPSCENPSRP